MATFRRHRGRWVARWCARAGEEEPGARWRFLRANKEEAIRTDRYKYVRRFDDYPYPVLPNCDESPSKNAYLERGWATRAVPRESLHDLAFNPGEGRNYIDNDGYSGVLAELRERLEEWMVGTDDPLLRGPVAPPVGAQINAQSQRSASDPTFVIEEADVAAPR